MTGFKKVSHKARRNRKRQPQGHKQHRRPGAISDPITRAKKRVMLEKRAEAERRAEEDSPFSMPAMSDDIAGLDIVIPGDPPGS